MMAITEKAMPAMVPMAKSNQKTSSGPSERKGRSPRMVDTMVRLIGVIFREKVRYRDPKVIVRDEDGKKYKTKK